MAQDAGVHGPVRSHSSEIRRAIMETPGRNRSKGCESNVRRKSSLPLYMPTQRSVPLTLRSRWWPSSLLELPCFVSTQRPHASRQHIRSLFVSVLAHVHTASLAQYLIMTYTISLGVWARTLRMRLCCVRSMTRAHPTSTLPLDCRTH